MSPPDADGPRRTQAWMGPAPASSAAPPVSPPAKAMRWMPSGGELPAYPGAPEQPASSAPQAPQAPRVSSHVPGQLVGARYRLVRQLGQGRLTETWEATHVELERAVAIKFVRRDAGELSERMVQEARAVARIHHPHVVEYSDFGREEGQPFFVMELLTGQTVGQLLARRGTIAWARVVAIAQQVAEGLGAAHQQGVVHRDLRPDNVFLVDTGQAGDFVKVLDFGIARGELVRDVTSYMSPEQCRGEQLDPRSDVYAMGCLLFAMITGDPPFTGDPQQVAWQHDHEQPRSLEERAPRQFIPEELEAVVARCLDKLPARRFADMRELGAELARIAQFTAAQSMAGAPVVDPSASGSMPMGYAGRPPPRSPEELTNSYRPVSAPLRDDSEDFEAGSHVEGSPVRQRARQRGRSVGAVVAIVIGAVLVVSAAGFGVYTLVSELIREEAPAGEASPASDESGARAAEVPAPPASAPESASATSPEPPAPSAPAGPSAGEDEAAQPPPAARGSADSNPAPSRRASARKKGATKDDEADAAVEPPPASPEADGEGSPPAEPDEEPQTPKPSIQPDSRANEGIRHEELLDPWG